MPDATGISRHRADNHAVRLNLGGRQLETYAWLVLCGVIVGLVAAFLLANGLSAMTFGVSTHDLTTFRSVPASLNLTQRIDDADRQAAQAWFGAAQGSVRMGDKSRGLDYAQRAAAHQAVKRRADELIDAMK